jgi:hypothetical protein
LEANRIVVSSNGRIVEEEKLKEFQLTHLLNYIFFLCKLWSNISAFVT